jgi:heme exporter protein B
VTKKSSFLHNSFFVFQKDLRQEFRTRYAVNAIFLFALTTLIVVSFSISAVGLTPIISSSLMWIIIFFSSMSGLSHIFVREEEQQTADTLKLVTQPISIYVGKWLFNTILLLGIEIVLIPLFLVFMNITVGNLFTFFVILLLGSIGVASVATIIAAIISRASAKGALFAVLSFPITLPVLVSAIQGTSHALNGESTLSCMSDIQVLFSFTVVIITASILLFEFVWIS